MFDGLQILSNTTKHDQTWSNMIKHFLVTKHVDVAQSGQMISNLFDKQ